MVSMYKRIYKSATKRKKIVLCVVVIVICCVTILQTDLAPDLYFFSFESIDNTTCYSSNESDSLPGLGEHFSPPVKSIHFHETSCNGRLNTRQACAVESAAVAHPTWQINVFFVGPVSKDNLEIGSLNVLKKYNNIKLLRLNLVEYAKGTPLENFVESGALNRTRWKISHTSDALRYISLYKWGGVYLDLDVVVARSFDELAPNWAARESESAVAAGALAFSKNELGRQVADIAIRDFKSHYRGDMWGNNGPGVITRILLKMCNTNNLVEMSTKSCKGFEVYGPELFYPIGWKEAKDYFNSTAQLNLGEPYTYHVWNKITQGLRVDKASPYAKLAKKYCPKVYETFGDNFGL